LLVKDVHSTYDLRHMTLSIEQCFEKIKYILFALKLGVNSSLLSIDVKVLAFAKPYA
jgi:hypothetical protein